MSKKLEVTVMGNLPLRYKISSWRQLSKCMSNNSRDLRIDVTDFTDSDKLTGLRIQVTHPKLGVLFACLIDAKGKLISCSGCNTTSEFTPEQILSELYKYGFIVQYNPANTLPGNQLQYLMTLDGLHFDKLRIMNVWSIDSYTGLKSFKTYVIAFMSDSHEYWLNNDYSCSDKEFTSALMNGTAINLTAISNTKDYNWSWLKGFVANISDVLKDNAEVTTCL